MIISIFVLCAAISGKGQNPALDYSFNALSSSGTGAVLATADLPDGRILVGGRFYFFQGLDYTGLVRLFPNGNVDTTFRSQPLWPGIDISEIVLDTEQRILIGGDFDEFDGSPAGRILRLLPDGERDLTFDPGSGTNSYLSGLILLPNGKILICGDFTEVDGYSRSGVARLMPDGAVDVSFDPGTGFLNSSDPLYPSVSTMALDAEGRILVGGLFDSFNGTITGPLVRLSTDGLLDPSFAPVFGSDYPYINDVLVLDDQRIRAAGSFTEVNSVGVSGVAGLLPDGTTDPLYAQGALVDYVTALQQVGDAMLVVGQFSSYGGVVRNGMARVDLNGSLDPFFDIGVGFGIGGGSIMYISGFRSRPDGSVLVFGDFDTFNGIERTDILLLNPPSDLVDCNGVSGGTALPGTACDDGNPGTDEDIWNSACVCIGTPVPLDCNGVPSGPAQPGTACDDGDPDTTEELWSAECICIGTPLPLDCIGVLGGDALPGTPCDDGILWTTNDMWSPFCDCLGFDCEGWLGGVALPGTECNDGLSWTYNDVWSVGCLCSGVGIVGIEVMSANPSLQMHISPNPSSSGEVKISFGTSAIGHAVLYVADASGRLLLQQNIGSIPNGSMVLSVGELSSGTYVVRLVSEQWSFIGRLVIQ